MKTNLNGRRSTAVFAAALFLCAASFAHAQKVYADYNHDVNFGSFHTFSIYRVHAADPLMQNRLRSDISASMREHGWQEVPNGGDIAITAIGDVKQQQEYTTFYNDLGPGWGYGGWGGRWGWGGWGGRGWGWGGDGVATTRSQVVPIGTLALDMYDTRTHQLIFRGTASDELSTKHADKNARKGAKAVEKIIDKVPHGSKEG